MDPKLRVFHFHADWTKEGTPSASFHDIDIKFQEMEEKWKVKGEFSTVTLGGESVTLTALRELCVAFRGAGGGSWGFGHKRSMEN